MGTEIILLAVGLALVLLGAEMLVEHASRIARHWGVSEFVIGATVVAFGTSAPEMVVSFIAALEGNSDMAAGNVIGSNILNAALILGLSALLAPIAVSRENRRRDIPLHLLATGLLVLIGTRFRLLGTGQDLLGRFAGLLFLALFAWYLYISFHAKEPSSEETKHGEGPSVTKSYLLLVLGLVALIAGGRLFVDEASALAHHIGLSDKFIAITVLAAGTSLPELATSCVAATKGKTGLALGNVIGSNITNILLVLGGAALIHPLDMQNIAAGDYLALMACALFIPLAAVGKRHSIGRLGGLLLLAIEAAYMLYLFKTL